MVPEGWKRQMIGSVCETIIDCVNKTAPIVDFQTPYKMIRTTNVRDGRVDTTKVRYVIEETYKKWVRRGAPRKGDIIFTREAPVGEVGVLEEDDGIFLGQRTMMYRADANKSDAYFLFYSLQSEFCQKQIGNLSNGGTVAHMRVPDCEEIVLNIPPLPEQKKIARILSTWDKAITTTEQLLANSQQQKKALMQQLLTGKKRLLDENGERFYANWSRSTLGDLGVTFSGLSGKKKDDFGKGKKFITYVNIFKNSQIDLNEIGLVSIASDESQSKVRFGDIFFTTSSETNKEVGMSSVLLSDPGELYLNSFCFGFRLHDFKTLSPEYARYILRSYELRSIIAKLGQGATRYNLSKKQLMKVELNLPPIQEQKKVVAVLSLTDLEMESLREKLEHLKKEKKALMQQLLTGKRRVKIAERV